jgi:hypothetical protein
VKITNLIDVPKSICAIDASTNSIAFAIFDDGKLSMYGKINFTGKNIYLKGGDAAQKTLAMFKKFKIDAIVIEQVVYLNSPKTLLDLSIVHGAVTSAAIMSGVKNVYSVPPITWQTYIGNKKLTKEEQQDIKNKNPGKSLSWYKTRERELRKERTIRLMNIEYDTSISDNDVADAVGIGHYAINNPLKVFSKPGA